MFSFLAAARADVIQHWPPAAVELEALLRECGTPGERVEEDCIERRMGLDYYLRDVVAAAPEAFVRRRQMWREWHHSRYAKVFPAFKTSGDPFVVFTIYREAMDELVVTALHFGHNRVRPGFDHNLRVDIVEPRVSDLAYTLGWRP